MKKPNIVWVLTDDQGTGDLACNGNPIIKTPNIDEFYNNSVHMTNYHVGPTCAPTRSTLMTGHYANSTGVWHTVGGRSLLREDEWTIADALKEGGYKTGIFGKWHLGDTSPYHPWERGFDIAITHGGGGISQMPDHWGNDYFDDTYTINGVPQKFEGYCTDVFFKESLKFIDENKDNQFFCYIACNAPHGPFNVPKKYYDMYKDNPNITKDDRKRFYGMISNIDENFGKLISHLEELEILDDTIVIFMTDNGSSCGIDTSGDAHVTGGYNAGLRGGKGSEYDGGHRVPFFMQYNAQKLNTCEDITKLTASIDVMPTLLDYCGIDTKEHTFHGKSIRPILEGKEVAQRAIVTDSQRVPYPEKWRKSAVMTEQWRLINGAELYDINEDRAQINNIAGKHQDIVTELRSEYDKWWNIVSEKYDQDIPSHIKDEEVQLTSHDLRNMLSNAVYSQRQVRDGEAGSGYWELKICEDGVYNIELRRWPKESPRAICAGIDKNDNDIFFEKDLISANSHSSYLGGKALQIEKSFICIDGETHTNSVGKDELYSSFTIKLKKGHKQLKAWFKEENQRVLSAYYVYITKNKN